jgi:hypothetical protein
MTRSPGRVHTLFDAPAGRAAGVRETAGKAQHQEAAV